MSSISSPVPNSIVMLRFLQAARNSGSLAMSANALRSAASRSAGTAGVVDDGAADLRRAGDRTQYGLAVLGQAELRQRRHVRQQRGAA